MGNSASLSEPTPSTPKAQKAQQPHPKAKQGPECHKGPPLELAEATWATYEQSETSPSPGPSDLEGPLNECPHRATKAFSSQRKESAQGHSQTAEGETLQEDR